ncbi:leucine--tRNA ligase [Candidatus Parcubacteria bacterium]|nr:leucine--tRNA ligase [Candidatus Parcubacteria bacterium]
MKAYNPQEIEKKWQDFWNINGTNKTQENGGKPKFYVLDMFPYPSGSAMHVGHCKGYIASDIIARQKMMQGYNVLHPMGWDAFGLPAENFAIKNKIHPKIAVQQNIKNFREQIEKIGFTYDWSREINTTDPYYYKWTQWAFLRMFENGLVKEAYDPVNWCPSCRTVLANEDVEQGKCERCGSDVIRKPIREWSIEITKYADRLLNDLNGLDWEKAIIEQQINWIGKSEGAEIEFKIKNQESKIKINEEYFIKIFTTRLDTIFGCTYVVIAPEHSLINELKDNIQNWGEVEKYIEESKKKSDLQRTELQKEKTGVEIKGIKAINPFNGEEIPVFVGDYVLGHYGTGAIMAVPAHDQRDFEFAKKHNLEIIEVVKGEEKIPFTEDGVLINSGEFNSLVSKDARVKMAKFAKDKNFGKEIVAYKMRDWIFARQRYWGEPIPLVFCEHCKQEILNGNKKNYSIGEINNPGWIADWNLPLVLPEVESYQPTDDGQSPLANIREWVNTKCPKCNGDAIRETNTMPQWAGSCWYYLRYIDPKNNEKLIDIEKEEKWMPVDIYIGGAEHATRHLLYARFWHKFLNDIKVVKSNEPFKKLQHVGLILGEDGQKMSKRWGNVINPDDVVIEFGADSLRVYEMFMGKFEESCAWSTNGLMGAKRFLEKVWNLQNIISEEDNDQDLVRLLHKTIKKVGDDISVFKFNTAISSMMIFVNESEKKGKISKRNYLDFLKILAPFAPHISEEIFSGFSNNESIFYSSWPEFNQEMIRVDKVEISIQVNGKLRSFVECDFDSSQEFVLDLALKDDKIKKWIDGKQIKKNVFVKNKLINIVVS